MKTKKPVKKVEKPPVKKVKKPYHLEVSVNDTEFKTDANSIIEALTEFKDNPDFPVGVSTNCVIKISKGKSQKQKILLPGIARRRFNLFQIDPLAVELLANELEQVLNE
jgi:hypothetical protein